MVWTAPLVERSHPPDEGDESTLLITFLEFHRETFLWKCSGLSGEQLAERPVASSTMSMLGLIRHLTDVERYWFRDIVAGEDVTSLYWGRPDRDSDFDDAVAADAERDYSVFLAELDLCRRIQGAVELDAVVVERERRNRFTVRWVMIHLIEEYARHNGHADLFRQAIDGAVGE